MWIMHGGLRYGGYCTIAVEIKKIVNEFYGG